MDINTSSLAHLAFGSSPNTSWPVAPGSNEATQDAAAWFQGDASGARIALPTGLPDTLDVGTLAQRVLTHLTA
jgi:hypothetical protein